MPVFKANHTEPDILSGFFFVGKRFFIVSRRLFLAVSSVSVSVCRFSVSDENIIFVEL